MGYCNESKKPATITDLICEYCNVCIKLVAIKGPICGYYIYEMALWNL
jgi:hypothetical protein